MPRLPLLIPLLVALAIGACADKRSPKSSGGGVVDSGGGGDFVYNTPETVRKAIEKAWSTLLDESPSNPMVVAYNLLSENKSRTADDERVLEILKKTLSGSRPFQHFIDGRNLGYLKSKKPKLAEDALCSGPSDHQFLASVTKLNRDGEICVSVNGLVNIPMGTLMSDVIGLLVHEIVHLNGYGERDARLTHSFFIRNMNFILRKDGKRTREQLLFRWVRVAKDWPTLLTYEELSDDFFRDLNSFSKSVDGFQIHLQQTSYQDDLQYAKPELTGAIRLRLLNLRLWIDTWGRDLAQRKAGNTHARINVGDFERINQISQYALETTEPFAQLFLGEMPELVRVEMEKESKLLKRALNAEAFDRLELRPSEIFCNLPPADFYSRFSLTSRPWQCRTLQSPGRGRTARGRPGMVPGPNPPR